MNNSIKTAVTAEAKRLEENATYSAKSHLNAGAVWSKVHYCLGLPAAVLAALAGIKAFQNDPVMSGWIAVTAAIFAAVNAFLNPSDKAAKHRSAGHELLALQNEARRLHNIRLALLGDPAADAAIADLAARLDQINSTSRDIPWFAYSKAKKGIENGEATHEVDKEET